MVEGVLEALDQSLKHSLLVHFGRYLDPFFTDLKFRYARVVHTTSYHD